MPSSASSARGMSEKLLEYDRLYRWRNSPARSHLYRRRCKVVATGSTKHSVLLEFEDGERVICSRRATMRIR